jgi:hypothetical protein
MVRRMRDVKEESMPGAGVSGAAKQLTIPDLLDRIPKRGPDTDALRCRVASGLACRYALATPRYEAKPRELWVGDIVVRRYARTAWNQIAVLELFESQSWVPRIEDPLGTKFDPKYASRLKNTVSRLNHGQTTWLVHFHGHGIDRAISWERRIPLNET